ncbi:MAG: zinc-binding dehydrogenase [Frankia sp.]
MYAARLHAFGPPDNLRWERVDDPVPAPGQVIVAVASAGVHLIDTVWRAGIQRGPAPLPPLPMTLGREVAGVVDALGPDVDAAWLGRRVVAHLASGTGGYAERVAVAVGALHGLPAGLGDAAAVAMIGTGRTTLGILEVAELKPDDVVLVTAAAGGIGTLLIQAAQAAGAVVVAVAGGPGKLGQVRALEAAVAVDYLRPGWPATVRSALGDAGVGPVTVALDGVGGEIGRSALELVGPGGRVVTFGWASGSPTPPVDSDDRVQPGVTVTTALGPRMFDRPGGLRSLEEAALAAAAAGTLVPVVGQRFSLPEAAVAHRAVETRATVGKTVLVPG